MPIRTRPAVHNVTAMPLTADEERRIRMRNYTISMAIRTLCFVSLIWVRGWWMLIPLVGAVLIPYFAVVLANARGSRRAQPVERPSSIALYDAGMSTGHETTFTYVNVEDVTPSSAPHATPPTAGHDAPHHHARSRAHQATATSTDDHTGANPQTPEGWYMP